MPVISSLNLTNQHPTITYTASVVTSGSLISDGLGNQLTSLQLTASNATSASSAKSASFAISTSFSAVTSLFTPSQGTITNAGALTGSVSASGFGFSSAAEFNSFITSVSSSLKSYNTLLTALRSSGVIT